MSEPRVIKKYPNRRLYDTVESRYITLADVRRLVVERIEFVVVDKKNSADITRSILLQVIAEQEHLAEPILSQEFMVSVIRLRLQFARPGESTVELSLKQLMSQPAPALRERVKTVAGGEGAAAARHVGLRATASRCRKMRGLMKAAQMIFTLRPRCAWTSVRAPVDRPRAL